LIDRWLEEDKGPRDFSIEQKKRIEAMLCNLVGEDEN
jgi:hypothetical protein